MQSSISSGVENGRGGRFGTRGEARQRALEVHDKSILLGVSGKYSFGPLDLFA